MGRDYGRSNFLFPGKEKPRQRRRLRLTKRLAKNRRLFLPFAALAEGSCKLEVARVASVAEGEVAAVLPRAGAGYEVGRLRKGWLPQRENHRLLAEWPGPDLFPQLVSRAPQFDFARS